MEQTGRDLKLSIINLCMFWVANNLKLYSLEATQALKISSNLKRPFFGSSLNYFFSSFSFTLKYTV